jgi:hypothetical protein
MYMYIRTDAISTNSGLGIELQKAKYVKCGVTDLIYVAAYAFQEVKSMITGVRYFDHEELMPFAFDFADDMSCVSRDPKTLPWVKQIHRLPKWTSILRALCTGMGKPCTSL